MNFQTADLYDLYAERLQVALPLFFSYGSKKKFSGEIVTIKCHEDNSLVAEQVSTPGHGRVLVVDGGGSLRCALVGDNLAQKAIENGWEGIVVFGCIRDSAIINVMDIGIKALQTNPAKSVKRNMGVLNETVRFADVSFAPGAILYADEDGIVVSNTRL
nr:ribonuclease E activity regulator RraA [uncultured Flavobacterium sp.]